MAFPLIPVAAAAGVLIFLLAKGGKKITPSPFTPVSTPLPKPPGPVPPPPPPPPAPSDLTGIAWAGEPYGGYGTPGDTSTPPPAGSPASDATIAATADAAGYKSGRIDGRNDGEAGDSPHPKPDPPSTESALYTSSYVSGYNRGYTEGFNEGHIKFMSEGSGDEGTSVTGYLRAARAASRVAFWRHRR